MRYTYKYAQYMNNLRLEDERLVEVFIPKIKERECLRCGKIRKMKENKRICDRCKLSKDFELVEEYSVLK